MSKARTKALVEGSLRDQLGRKSRKRRDEATRMVTSSSPRPARNDLFPSLTLIDVKLADLRVPSRNVRELTAAHVAEVAETIRVLGFCVPVLIDKSRTIVDGVVRLEAAKRLGLDHVPCIEVGHLTPPEVSVLRIAVNRLTERGTWDLNALRLEFKSLIIEEAPIEIIGFTADEVDHIILGDDADGFDNGPLEPERGARPVARRGDCFQLGKHRVLCGDATDATVVEHDLRGDDDVTLVLTDVPYNVPVTGHVSRGAHREFVMASGEMSPAEYLAFNQAWMTHAGAHLRDGGVLSTFCDWRGYGTVLQAASSLELTLLNLVVWTKTNAGMGSLYRSQHELLPLFKKGRAGHVNNIGLGAKGRWRSNVWTYPGASSLGSEARRGLKQHPTVKPVAMLEDALLDLTNRGDLVFDPFLGSGSTLMAAERTHRVCRGLELDPGYVDVIIQRYQDATGTKATLCETGETFEALARRRGEEQEPDR